MCCEFDAKMHLDAQNIKQFWYRASASEFLPKAHAHLSTRGHINSPTHTWYSWELTLKLTLIARYTLFTNNSEIGVKQRKNDVRRIVYKRRLPCFANRFFAVDCTQDLHWGSGLVEEHKVFFRWKKIVCRTKIDGEQRTVYSNKFVSFSPTIFYSVKK